MAFLPSFHPCPPFSQHFRCPFPRRKGLYHRLPFRQAGGLFCFNNFKQYTLNAFNDPEQEALKLFCDRINEHGGRFLLSNSDSELEPGVSYFDRLYEGYHIQHITAPRSINAHSPGIQMCSEILVKNY